MTTIDARGLECPKPVIETKKITDQGAAEVTVLVDNEVAVSNVTRFLEGQGFKTSHEGGGKNFTITGSKQGAAPAPTAAPAPAKCGCDYSILFKADKLGAESNGLGEVLMKSYLGVVAQNPQPPVAIALMNEGVKMALKESSARDTLAALEAKGVKILVCGTCTKHFGITDQVTVGVISNMFEISEAVFGASKPIVLG